VKLLWCLFATTTSQQHNNNFKLLYCCCGVIVVLLWCGLNWPKVGTCGRPYYIHGCCSHTSPVSDTDSLNQLMLVAYVYVIVVTKSKTFEYSEYYDYSHLENFTASIHMNIPPHSWCSETSKCADRMGGGRGRGATFVNMISHDSSAHANSKWCEVDAHFVFNIVDIFPKIRKITFFDRLNAIS